MEGDAVAQPERIGAAILADFPALSQFGLDLQVGIHFDKRGEDVVQHRARCVRAGQMRVKLGRIVG
jgi:hypothetical protein